MENIIDKVLSNQELEDQTNVNRMRQAQIPITVEDFDSVIDGEFNVDKFKIQEPQFMEAVEQWCNALNYLREMYLKTNDYKYWALFWDLVPTGYVYDT